MNKKNNFLIAELIYAGVMLLLIAVRVMGGFGWFDDIEDWTLDVGYSVVSQLVIMLSVPYFAYRIIDTKRQARAVRETNEVIIQVKRQDATFADFGFRKISGRWIGFAFALGFMVYIFAIFVNGVSAVILDTLGYRFPRPDETWTGWWGLLVTLILSCVLPGLCEEVTHRGMLLNGLRSKFSNYRAVLCVSVMFGLMHMNVQQFLYTMVSGWFICMAAISSRSLWVPIIIHATNNAISTYLGAAEELNLWGVELFQFVAGGNIFISIFVLILILAGIGLIMRIMARENFQKNKNVYVAKYMALHQNEMPNVEFERVGAALERAIAGMPAWKAVFAYCETNEKPQKLTALERALLTAMLVAGGLITVFTLHWGLL